MDEFARPQCRQRFTHRDFPFTYEYVGQEMPRKVAARGQSCPNCRYEFTNTYTCPKCGLGVIERTGVRVENTVSPRKREPRMIY